MLATIIGLLAWSMVLAAVVIDPEQEPGAWQFKQPKRLVMATDERPVRSVRILNAMFTPEQAATYEGLMSPQVSKGEQIDYLKSTRDNLIRDGVAPTAQVVIRIEDRITQLGGTP